MSKKIRSSVTMICIVGLYSGITVKTQYVQKAAEGFRSGFFWIAFPICPRACFDFVLVSSQKHALETECFP